MADQQRRERALRAPAWLEELVRTTPPPVPWRDVARFAVAIPGPLVLAVLLGGLDSRVALGAGVFGTMGALAASLAPQPGPLRDRMRRIGAATAFGMLGLLAGQYASGGGWEPVVVIAALSGFAALVSAVNAAFSLGALQLLIYTALASGLVTPLPAAVEVGFFLCGAGWATLIALVQARTDPLDPDRAAVAAVFTRIAELLAAVGTDSAPAARRALTTALNAAYDRVIRSRSRSPGLSRELSELAGVLNAAAPLVEGAVAAARAGVPADPCDVSAGHAFAAALTGSGELSSERPRPLQGGHPSMRAVRHGVRLVWNVVGDPEERASAAAPSPAPSPRARLREVVDRTLGSRDTRSFAVRLSLCMTVAEIVRQYLPIERPYWVLLTVAIILKPDFGSVFTRAVQRGVGTLLGVLLGSALLVVLPHDAWVLAALTVSAAVLPWARDTNFGMFSVFQTPLIILLLDLALPSEPGLVAARLLDTLVGCAIVLVFGYLLWPQTWRAPLDEALRDAVLALDAFVDAAFTGGPVERRRARRRNYRALTELQTQLQRRLAEPPPISTRAAAWWPVIVQLERTSDAVTEAVIATRGGEPAPDPAQVAVLRRAIRRLEDDVRTPGAVDDAELHAEGVLAPVAREVDAARRLVREAAPGRRTGHRAAPPVAPGGTALWDGPVPKDPPPLTLPPLDGPPPPGSRTVTTDDGVDLHVEFDGPAGGGGAGGDTDAPLTVVLCHGFTARLAEWEVQREALRGRARLVLWDQRGHGRSGWTPLTRATIDRTGQDLGQVLDAVVPSGPVVLAGHSMGGMSILALARQRPELFGTRVVGALLLATSAGGLVDTGPAGFLVKTGRRLGLLSLYLRLLQLLAPFLERRRRRDTWLGRRAIRRLLFGRDDADPRSVRMVQRLLEETPLPVTMAFYATFLDHDETAALPVLRRVPVTVVAGTHDRLTPAAHGRRIAEAIGADAELVVVPGAGHSVNLTRRAVVDRALLDLLDRVEHRTRKAG
ncbi:alpha/beta fold hydrolase [Blastococcus saxobsidens]|uniref:Uncharacterized protein n=1 Tax=Blastococcus saxobsidens (strain DD2) TaxID=1146883 RepID=H6RR22_BLASD|nr:alpha/beta fold hydrolase [Blastococcus saxobsidens]CCG02901.1 protein of unknown function [Blastococcus saxobsidens DD2]